MNLGQGRRKGRRRRKEERGKGGKERSEDERRKGGRRKDGRRREGVGKYISNEARSGRAAEQIDATYTYVRSAAFFVVCAHGRKKKCRR